MTALDVLFISGDIGGNVPPTLGIASELARRGHRVAVAGIPARQGDGWPGTIAEVVLPALATMDMTRDPGILGHVPNLQRMAMGRAVTRDVRAVLGRHPADVVVVDGAMLTSIREAVRSGAPTAVLFHSLGQFWSDGMSNGALNAFLRPFGLAPLALLESAHARLLPTDRDIDPAGRGGSRIAFDWIGTTERGLPPEPRVPGEPSLVLVSLSTAWQKKQGDVYRRIIAALGQLVAGESPVRAIVTTGGAQIDGALEALLNVEVRGRSPHAEIMPRADLVIGHGGHSTTLRALAHGVPVLILPLDATADQTMVGQAVEAAGAGRSLSRNATVEQVREAVRSILADKHMRATAARIGERLRGQRGAELGADRIEAIARG